MFVLCVMAILITEATDITAGGRNRITIDRAIRKENVMRFRNGVVYRDSRKRSACFIKVIRRNTTRTFGKVVYVFLNTGDNTKYEASVQKMKHFTPLYGH